jgi:anti-sigma B factor antagonist
MGRTAVDTRQSAGPLLVLVHWQGACASLMVSGELDLATAPLLTAYLTSVLAQQPRQLTMDLARLAFADCAGLAPIVRARRLLPPGRPLILRSPRPATRMLLRLTGLDQVCDVETG